MSRYVDADSAHIYLNAAACKQIKYMPTADVQEVRHGKWKKPDSEFPYYNWKCSVCGCEEYRQVGSKGQYREMNYCPNCGAKMDLEEESEWPNTSDLSQTKSRKKKMNKPIIDVCCGSKMFWFDKNNPNVEFCDKRVVPKHEFYPHRYIEITPDTVCDFTNLPFADKSFKLAVFDPPHLIQVGETSWLALKYGRLDENWKQMLHDGFEECMRVLDDYGILIFKWSEVQIPLSKVLPLFDIPPLFGNRSGKHNNTHWLCFMKFGESEQI